MSKRLISLRIELISRDRAAQVLAQQLGAYNETTRRQWLHGWFDGRPYMPLDEFNERLNERLERLSFHRARPEIHDGEVVFSIPANVRYFGIKLLVETSTSDRLIDPSGYFMCPLGFEIDAEFLRKGGFYKEPFVFKLQAAGQESQSV